MNKGLSVIGLGLFLTAAPVLSLQAQEKGADELAAEGLGKLMDALGLFIDSIPQYEAPEVLENGDIIIRRKKDKEEAPKEDDGGVEKTAT